MSYRSSRSGYSVRVDEIPLGPSRFAIQATIAYAPRISAADRVRLAPRAEAELVLAIAGEWERGRRRGARAVRILVDGDRGLARRLAVPAGPRAAARPSAGAGTDLSL